MKSKTAKKPKQSKKVSVEAAWEPVNIHAAGVDIGAREHWACVPATAAAPAVRKFGTVTAELEALADWFKTCGITSVAMEATGVYWIPLFQILERRGFQVMLVNARQTKNVAARSTQCQHMQKALQQMNLPLTQVLSDVTGVSGLAIIAAMLKGERDPAKLAALVDRRVRASVAAIEQALTGDYRPEQLFVLEMAHALYHEYEARIHACDERIVAATAALPARVDPALTPLPPRKAGTKPSREQMAGVNLRAQLYEKFGVDLTAIESIGVLTGIVLLTEIGPDLRRFKSEKHFCSWLGLCPDNRISGGKVLSSKTRRVVNRASDALRLAATTLERSQSALGGFARRMKARLGAAAGITATAHKLARIIYRLITRGEPYVRQGLADYEKKFQSRKLQALQKTAQAMGFELLQKQSLPTGVS